MTISKGERFRVFGADSTGEVVAASPSTVSYRFDHAPEKVWAMKAEEFAKKTYPLV